MGIGGGIFLMTVGGILAYAVEVEPHWLDLDVVGWVLIVAGATLVVLTVWFWRERRRKGERSILEETLYNHQAGPVMPDPPDVELRNPTVPPEPPNLPPPTEPPAAPPPAPPATPPTEPPRRPPTAPPTEPPRRPPTEPPRRPPTEPPRRPPTEPPRRPPTAPPRAPPTAPPPV